MGSHSVRTHWMYQYYGLYLARWRLYEPKHVAEFFNFNIDCQCMLCHWRNKYIILSQNTTGWLLTKHLILVLPILLLPLGLLTNIFLTTFHDRCNVSPLKSALQGKRLKRASKRLAYHSLAAFTDCCGHQNARTVIFRPIWQVLLTSLPYSSFIVI